MEMTEARKQNWGRQEKGFTFIELMLGISIFVTALFGLMYVLAQSLAMGQFSNDRTIAMNDARRGVEEIRNVADSSGLPTVVGTNWVTWANVNLANALSGETVSVTDRQGNSLPVDTDPLPVRVSISWTEKGKASFFNIDTLV